MKAVVFRATIAATVLLASSAASYAADLSLTPIYKAPRSAAPLTPTWSGFYVGANAGYAKGKGNTAFSVLDTTGFFDPPEVPSVAAAGTGPFNASGFTGGLQAGYNWQWRSFVFGVEADAGYMALKGSRDGTATEPGPFGVTEFVHQQIKADWLFTARARVGYAFDNLLIYGTGGFAGTQVKYSFDYSNSSGFFSTTGSSSKLMTGWALGAGVEYALARSWSVKAEYLYADLGHISFDTVGSLPPFSATFTSSTDLKIQLVRAGVNYHF